ncbi:MAG TPA: dethiobiotin synthase [Novosphingobium sp.]|nr:dethiobiotin synthase [Novosphingobium sp.]
MTASGFIVTGTDTDVGKTVFAAALAAALGAHYWKPVQAGLDAEGLSDSERTMRLAGLPASHILAERYRLATPCSPHRAAEIEGVTIETDTLGMPPVDGPLVIEGAGGVLVPLTREVLYADLFARWGLPVILVARTTLGTINHSLLSIEALRARGIAIHGVAFVGEGNADSEETIARIGEVRRLGRLPWLTELGPETLSRAFAENFGAENFRIEDFTP